MKSKYSEVVAKVVFAATACVSICAVVLICVFLFANAVPAISEIGLDKFLAGTSWKPANDVYGILPMILGSLYVTVGALILGIPVGILTATYLAFYAGKKVIKIVNPCVELLAGIPSVVYGFFGLMIIVPFIRNVFGGTGNSILAASVLLGIMILPTIITVSYSSLKAIPESYYEGALALGATKEQSIFFAVIPAGKSGITAGVILALGRALGETMAVIMVAGNQARLPSGILKGVRTLTSNIVIEMGYASGLHREALIATGVVLFVFILIINFLFSLLKKQEKN